MQYLRGKAWTDCCRPHPKNSGVTREEFDANWERTFGKKEEKQKKYRIVKNSARCKKCNAEVESKYRRDFVTCPCGAISVDGGKDYLRRCGNLESIEETFVCEEIE